MNTFTFILQYRGYTSISQVKASNVFDALRLWCVRLPRWRDKSLPPHRKLLAVELRADNLVAVKSVRNVWCASGVVRDGLALLNIVLTEA